MSKDNFFKRAKEIEEKAQALEEQAEREAAEEEQRQRAEYEKQLQDEKIELMKLKAGVMSEEETTIKKEEAVQKEYTFSEKVENFFYHYKWQFLLCCFTLVVLAYLIAQSILTVKPDIKIMCIAGGFEMESKVTEMEHFFERYCPDFNGDGKTKVDVYYMATEYIDGDYYSMQNYQVGSTKIIAEFQSDEIIMAVTGPVVCDLLHVYRDPIFTDMRELYPDDENALLPGYKVSAFDFGEQVGFPDMPGNYMLSLRNVIDERGYDREKMQQNYDNALILLENIKNDNVLNPDIQILREDN